MSQSLIVHVSVLAYRSLNKHLFNQLLHVLGAGVMCVLSVLFVYLHACLFFLTHEIVSATNKCSMPSSVYPGVGCAVDV